MYATGADSGEGHLVTLRSRVGSAYWRLLEASRRIVAVPGMLYAGAYILLRLDAVYHALGLSAPAQLRLLPRRLWVSRRQMSQPYVVRVADIRWGGRPSGGEQRVGDAGLGNGLVFDGAWDMEDKRPVETYLSSYIYSRTVLQMFRDGMPYQETAQYAEISKVVTDGARGDWRARGCRNEGDIRRYFEDMAGIYRSIGSNGYASQQELGSPRWFDEIKVFVDRNGELHKQQGAGHHRLTMARILGVERIPVVVIGVHAHWALAAQREFGLNLIASIDRRIRRDIACE